MRKLFTFLAAFFLLSSMYTTSAQSECSVVSYTLTPGIFANEVSFELIAPTGEAIAFAQATSAGNNSGTWCLPNGCYTVLMFDSFGDGWNGATLTINMMDGNVYQGTLPTGSNGVFNFGVNTENCGSVVLGGCTNPEAANYDSSATVDNGSCIIYGCTSQNATNYNGSATFDDGSCNYCDGAGSVISTLYLCTFGNAANVELQIVDSQGNEVAYVYGGVSAIQYVTICLQPGECYTANMINNQGPNGWYGGYFWVNGAGAQYINDQPNATSLLESVNFSIDGTCGPIAGCTDPNADNYNSEAQISNNSCVYSGCTDPNALNYDYQATSDDGSCQYCNAPGSVLASLYICTFSNGGEVEFQILDDQGNEVTYVSGFNNGAIYNAQICLQPGTCYTVNMINNAGPYGWYNGYYWINVNGWQVSNSSLPSGSAFSSTIFSIDGTCGPVVVLGCTDPNALNYNAEATQDNGTCQYPVWGCTNTAAINYNEFATSDDGTCVIAENCTENLVVFTLGGSTWNEEMSFNLIDESGLVVAYGVGASISYACLSDGCYTLQMMDSFGDGWDTGSLEISVNGVPGFYYTFSTGTLSQTSFGINTEGCGPAPIYGCTDPNAINYNPQANANDGSCYYEESCDGTLVNIYIETQTWGSEVNWSLVSEDGAIVASGSGYNSWGSYYTTVCLPIGCYQFVMNDTWGDGWNGAYYIMYGENTYSEGSLLYGSSAADFVGVGTACGDVAGCTDAAAMNYNPAATYDDGSCMYNDNNPFNGEMPGILEIGLSVFPNPTNGGMVVDVTDLNATENIKIVITSLDGKVVKNIEMANQEASRRFNLDVTELANGYYVMSLQNGSNRVVNSFIKN
jgi:hypothetical protein